MIYRDLFFTMLAVVFIVDLSGFMDTFKTVLEKITGRDIDRVRPFDCSLCMTWWVCLAYAFFASGLTPGMVAYIALLSWVAFPVGSLLQYLLDVITSAIDELMGYGSDI
ncbi:MAG: hypothetical protein NC115_12105 [Bacteroidales bacterium]|nr:hypothetical protein [Bacteroidales bacterium]